MQKEGYNDFDELEYNEDFDYSKDESDFIKDASSEEDEILENSPDDHECIESKDADFYEDEGLPEEFLENVSPEIDEIYAEPIEVSKSNEKRSALKNAEEQKREINPPQESRSFKTANTKSENPDENLLFRVCKKFSRTILHILKGN